MMGARQAREQRDIEIELLEKQLLWLIASKVLDQTTFERFEQSRQEINAKALKEIQ